MSCPHGVWHGDDCEMCRAETHIASLERELEEKQMKIDALMLEFCPEGMTVQQIVNWSNNQRALEAANKGD